MAVWREQLRCTWHLPITSRGYAGKHFTHLPSTSLDTDDHRRDCSTSCVTPSLITSLSGAGIVTGCPSPTSFDLGLGPASPWEDNPSPGNLGLSAEKILTSLFATYTGILTSLASTVPHGTASQVTRTLPYHCVHNRTQSAASVHGLSPVYFRRPLTRPVSYYALFQGWLLLSQPPGCLGQRTSFTT